MELTQAINSIKRVTNKFAEEAILCIKEHKEEAIPDLLKIVYDAIDEYERMPEAPENEEDTAHIDDPIYAMFLLAESREHAVFEALIRMLELEHEKCEWLLVDAITEDMDSLIASVALPGDIGRIKVVVENAEINEYQRNAALDALIIMYSDGKYPRAELLAYLGQLLDERADDEELVTHIVCSCHDIDAREHYGRICELYQERKVDTSYIGVDEFMEDAPALTEDEVLANLRSNPHTRIITDTVASMRWWACFNEKPKAAQAPKQVMNYTSSTNRPIVKDKAKIVGRNDPCPCGSGQKYKRCCLNKTNN